MKKALSVLVVAILAAGVVFASEGPTGPENLEFHYTVEGFYNCLYAYKHGEDTENGPFNFGSSANGKIEASEATVELYDKSFVNYGSELTITITFAQPTKWTKDTIEGSQVNLDSVTAVATAPTGITSLTAGEGTDNAKTFTIVYGADPVDFTASGSNEQKLADLKFTWAEAVVTPGEYKSTMTIAYTTT